MGRSRFFRTRGRVLVTLDCSFRKLIWRVVDYDGDSMAVSSSPTPATWSGWKPTALVKLSSCQILALLYGLTASYRGSRVARTPSFFGKVNPAPMQTYGAVMPM